MRMRCVLASKQKRPDKKDRLSRVKKDDNTMHTCNKRAQKIIRQPFKAKKKSRAKNRLSKG